MYRKMIPRKKNDSEEDEYYLQHPSQHKFYQVVGCIMGLLGLNTEYWDWYRRPAKTHYNIAYRIQRWLVITFIPIGTGSQVLYLLMHYSEYEFTELAVLFSVIPVTLIVSIKSGNAQTSMYKKAQQDFMTEIHLHNYLNVNEYDESKRNFIAKELVNIEKNTRRTCILMTFFVLVCLCSWHSVPLIHNIQNTEDIHNITTRLEVCVHFWMPFDYEFNFYGYLLIQVIGFYSGWLAIVLMLLFDTINFAFIYHVVGHIKIIKYDLQFEFKKPNLSEEEVKKKLVKLTKYYCFITSTFQMVTAVFGLNVAAIYAQNLVQGGLLIYQLMTVGRDLENLLTYGLLIPILMGTLMLVSITLDYVRIQAEDIPALVYGIPWESMSVSNQKIVLLILNQVQPTLEFRAAFNIRTGIQPAVNIIKTTFSYYVIIKERINLRS